MLSPLDDQLLESDSELWRVHSFEPQKLSSDFSADDRAVADLLAAHQMDVRNFAERSQECVVRPRPGAVLALTDIGDGLSHFSLLPVAIVKQTWRGARRWATEIDQLRRSASRLGVPR